MIRDDIGSPTRRAALAAPAALLTLTATKVFAPPSPSREGRFSEATGSYRFRIGAYEALVVSDGPLTFPRPGMPPASRPNGSRRNWPPPSCPQER